MDNNKILSYLGLCRKAGKLVCGTALTVDAIRRNKAVLAITCSDASDNTKKRVSDACSYRSVDYASLPCTCAELGAALGQSGTTAAAGITDKSFSDMIKKLLQTSL